MEMFRYNFTQDEKERALKEIRDERRGTKRKPFFLSNRTRKLRKIAQQEKRKQIEEDDEKEKSLTGDQLENFKKTRSYFPCELEREHIERLEREHIERLERERLETLERERLETLERENNQVNELIEQVNERLKSIEKIEPIEPIMSNSIVTNDSFEDARDVKIDSFNYSRYIIPNQNDSAGICKLFNEIFDLGTLIAMKTEIDKILNELRHQTQNIYWHDNTIPQYTSPNVVKRKITLNEALVYVKYNMVNEVSNNLIKQIALARERNTKLIEGNNWTRNFITTIDYKLYYSIVFKKELYLPIFLLHGINEVIKLQVGDDGIPKDIASRHVVDEDIYYFYEEQEIMINLGKLKMKPEQRRKVLKTLKECEYLITKIYDFFGKNRYNITLYVKEPSYGGKKSKRKPTRSFKKHRK